LYTDRHEAPEIKKYLHEDYMPFLQSLSHRIRKWDGQECEIEVPPQLIDGEAEVVLVFQDEVCYHSNDDFVKQWYERGNPPLKKKSLGASLMVSDFQCATVGFLGFTDEQYKLYVDRCKDKGRVLERDPLGSGNFVNFIFV
jgi:hypothetical protein